MGAVRAIRLGLFLAVVLTTVACAGCCTDCCSLCGGGRSKAQTSESPPAEPKAKAGEPKSEADAVLKQWRPAGRYPEQPERPAQERIRGGTH
ncbi:MAG: hypothetical protein ACKODX_21900 [Gemmata sp.]